MNKQQVKELALSNGFKLKQQPSGEMDLNPYVYDFADALLAKANERVKRLEKIFSEAPDLTFDDVQSMFSEELNKFAIENQVKGIYLATNNVADNNDLSYLPAEVSLELCEQFAEQLRKEQE